MKIVKKKKKNIVIRLALISFSIYVAVMLVDLQVKASEKRREHEALLEEIRQQEIINEQLKNFLSNDDYEKLIEKIAREKLDLVLPDERVFIPVNGK